MVELNEMGLTEMAELTRDLDSVLIEHGLTKESRIAFWDIVELGVKTQRGVIL